MILFLITFYDVGTIFDKNNLIDKFYNLLFTNVWKKLNHKTIEFQILIGSGGLNTSTFQVFVY